MRLRSLGSVRLFAGVMGCGTIILLASCVRDVYLNMLVCISQTIWNVGDVIIEHIGDPLFTVHDHDLQ